MATIDSTTPVIGPAAPTQTPPTTKKNDAMGKDEFLKLLVTQMKNQDPLNPMDGQEMAAQLAQFSSVEKLVSIDDTLAKIRELLTPATPAATPTDGATTDGTKTGTKTDGTKTDGTKTDGTKTDGTKTGGTKTDGTKTGGPTDKTTGA